MARPYHEWMYQRQAARAAKAYGFYAGVAWAHSTMIADAPDRLKQHYRDSARRFAKEARQELKRMREMGLMTKPLDEVAA